MFVARDVLPDLSLDIGQMAEIFDNPLGRVNPHKVIVTSSVAEPSAHL